MVLPEGATPSRYSNLELSRHYKYRPHAGAWEHNFGGDGEDRTHTIPLYERGAQTFYATSPNLFVILFLCMFH